MTYSEVTNHTEKTYSVNMYAYDALGRRTLTQGAAGQAMRTVYDGGSFEVIREGETFRDLSLTTKYSSSAQARGGSLLQSNQPTGERYRWIAEGGATAAAGEGYSVEGGRYGARGVTLYGRGEAVAVSYSSSAGSRSSYLGKDVMGSVRSVTGDLGGVEERYEYDAFGKPYKGDLSGGMNLGYTGKPYDTATGLYNYGFRDYKPEAARFTTADPIRDGSNWFAYVNNDPVNWIDPWGLEDKQIYTNSSNVTRSIPVEGPTNKFPGILNFFSATVTTTVVTTTGSNTINVSSYSTRGPLSYDASVNTVANLSVNGMIVDSAKLSPQPSILSAQL
jgi:RHS repeat-associated protein